MKIVPNTRRARRILACHSSSYFKTFMSCRMHSKPMKLGVIWTAAVKFCLTRIIAQILRLIDFFWFPILLLKSKLNWILFIFFLNVNIFNFLLYFGRIRMLFLIIITKIYKFTGRVTRIDKQYECTHHSTADAIAVLQCHGVVRVYGRRIWSIVDC